MLTPFVGSFNIITVTDFSVVFATKLHIFQQYCSTKLCLFVKSFGPTIVHPEIKWSNKVHSLSLFLSLVILFNFRAFSVFFISSSNRHFSHMTKTCIFKTLSLRKRADCNFRENFLKNRFRHLKLYWNPQSKLVRSHCYMVTFWKTKHWSLHFC